jgi:succinate-semialdehyde dehydrogenase/glutarate-semialdehyde dehydrogenase
MDGGNMLPEALLFLLPELKNFNSAKALEVYNPATSALLARLPSYGHTETSQAIETAEKALESWQQTTAQERADILKEWFRLLQCHAEVLGQLLTLEQGKPLQEAVGEIRYAAGFVEWAAEDARRIYGEVLPSIYSHQQGYVLYRPVGVVAAITPWNFPAAMVTRKVAPALAAGCTVILKPAEETPLMALALHKLALQAGIPADAFQLLHGDPVAIGGTLTASHKVRKISFTGSTEVGKLLYRQSADTVKKLTLENGGNAPFIVLEDCPTETAMAGILHCKFRNAGQTCISANRILIHSSRLRELLPRLKEAINGLKVGNGLDEGVNIGPLINHRQHKRLAHLIQLATEHGAEYWLPERHQNLASPFFAPSLLTKVSVNNPIWQEELFGPVVMVTTFETEEEAIRLANQTQAGLAAYLYGADTARLMKLASQLRYGMVGINHSTLSHCTTPFGGMRESGIGREGGRQGIYEFLETQFLAVAV